MKKILSIFLCVLLSISLIACASGETQHIHSYSEWTIKKESSCVTEGIKSRDCGDCGFVEYASIPMSAHKYDSGEIVLHATPIKQGLINYTCTTIDCTYSYMENYTLPLNNAYNILLNGLYANATSIENGYVAYDYYVDWQLQYALTYDEQKRDLVVCVRIRIENEGVFFFNITLEEELNLFSYLGLFEDINNSANSSYTVGYINGTTFTSATKLSYTSHYGTTNSFDSRMEIFGYSANKCLAFLNAFINEYAITINLYDLGFTAY